MDRAAELWDAIVEGGGLDLKHYDHDFLLELAVSLGVEANDFRNELERVGVTAQALLEAVFQLIAPYADMMTDILAFFARANARASSDNLRIHFDFGTANDSLDFDVENFRDWSAQIREVVTTVAVDDVDELLALQLRHAFLAFGVTYDIVGSTWTDLEVQDETVAQWIHQGGERSPLPLPAPPVVVDPELRSFLARAWALMRAAALSNATEPILSYDDIRSMVRGGHLLCHNEPQLLQQLRPVFAEIPTRSIDINMLVEQLLAVFNLPVWKRRSELYSIWVGARLMTTFGEAMRVHVVDRSLVFAFGGSHLATVRLADGENLHVWCELRTDATAGVVGKGRKKKIQPDYVILREPTSHPDSAALVVECKQYLKQSRKGFANALIDYASNHKNAVIALVNYGATSSSVILDYVTVKNAALLPRTFVIGMLRPRSARAIHEFEELIRSVLPPPERFAIVAAHPPPPEESPVSAFAGGTLRLWWLAAADLDLHCWLTDPSGNRQHVDYGHRNASIGASKVDLDHDVQTGGDVETLTWEVANDLSLDFAVFVFSPDTDIASTQPTVEMNGSNGRWILQPPAGRHGRWWNLFRIERGGSIRVWNSIANNSIAK